MGISNHDIENMKRKYPALRHIKQDDTDVFTGEVVLNHIFNDVRMTGKFNVDITVSRDFSLALPAVKEISNRIDKTYPHKYEEGYLCLASNLDLKMHFRQDKDISSFVDKYITPYFYTYRYFEEYGIYPYGERSHGVMGDLEYLKDLLNVMSWDQVFDFMEFVIQSSYRGHVTCPCGSEKRLRDCHGTTLRKMIDAGLREDCIRIMLELQKIYGKG